MAFLEFIHSALCDLEIASSRNTSSPTVFCSEEQIYFRCISNQTQLKWYLNGQVHFNFGRCLDIKCDADFYIKQTPDLCYASFFPEVNMSIFYILSATNNDTIGCNDQSIEITVLKGMYTINEVYNIGRSLLNSNFIYNLIRYFSYLHKIYYNFNNYYAFSALFPHVCFTLVFT